MEKKYGIGLFAVVVLFLGALSFAYHTEYQYAREQTEESQEKEAVSTQGDAKKEEIYYLNELNGYVVVYLNDQKTVFEYTNILLEDLPEELAEEIREGKTMEGTEKLYGFLENYSS